MQVTRVGAVVVSLLVPVVVSAVGAGPALAAPAGSAAPASSRSNAGQVATLQYGAPVTVRATFAVPFLTCPSPARGLTTTVGVTGVSVDSAAAAYGRLTASCSDGSVPVATVAALVSGGGAGPALAVRAGDRVEVVVSADRDAARAEVIVARTAATSTAVGPGFGPSRAVLELDARRAPGFGPVRFDDATVNDRDLARATLTAVTQVAQDGRVVAAPSGLAADGRSFVIRDRR